MEAEGFPCAGIYVGSDAIVAGVVCRLGSEWIGYRADVHFFLEDGERVAVFGIHSGTYKATGKSMTASFAHLYQVHDGKIASMARNMWTAHGDAGSQRHLKYPVSVDSALPGYGEPDTTNRGYSPVSRRRNEHG